MLEFSFNGLEVGYFKELAYPKSDGRFRYEPYRGPGHYNIAQALENVGEAVISFDDDGVRWSATAKKHEYGILMLSAFSSTFAHGSS